MNTQWKCQVCPPTDGSSLMGFPLTFSQNLHKHHTPAQTQTKTKTDVVATNVSSKNLQTRHQHICCFSPQLDGWQCVHWKYMALILKWSSLQRAECILNWLLPPINATEAPHGWFHPTLRLKGSFHQQWFLFENYPFFFCCRQLPIFIP